MVLTANGKSFSAGGDLNWMRRMADYSEVENLADAMVLAELMRTLDRLAKPTVALVHGAAFGGGVGLVAACDIAVAAEGASFCLSEVKLGLVPSVISPYVVAAIGARQARRYFLTAERFGAAEALRIGLVHRVVPGAALADAGRRVAAALAANAPRALAEAKDQLDAYFDGRLKAFDLPLKPAGTPFQFSVWARLHEIPYGATTTYGALARALNTAPLAVGGACGRNPLPIVVPCHRVTGAGGRITGYSAIGGIAAMKALLRLEGG